MRQQLLKRSKKKTSLAMIMLILGRLRRATLFLFTKQFVGPAHSVIGGGDQKTTITYYISNFERSFNKKLFEDNSITYYDFESLDDGKGFYATATGGNHYSIDFFGNVATPTSEERKSYLAKRKTTWEGNSWQQKVVSPDGGKIATLAGVEYGDTATLEIQDSSAQEDNQTYTFSGNGINGYYLVTWSQDGRYIYVAGGLYEFSAPAKLWRVDRQNKKITYYDQLTGMVFPVFISPKYNVALVRDADHFGDIDKNIKTTLHGLNLDTGEISAIVTENGTVDPLGAINDDQVYYAVEGGIHTLDLKTQSTKDFVRTDSILFPRYGGKSNFLAYDLGGDAIVTFFDDLNNQNVIGKARVHSCEDIEQGREYIDSINAASKY